MKIKLLIIFFCILIFGCKKNAFDYRGKFLGDYIFVVHNSSWYSGNVQIDTAYTIDGSVDYGPEKNSVLISSSAFSLQATVYEDGTLEGYWDNNGNGEFVSAKQITYSVHSYWPGGSYSKDITGEKK